jgi:hypothetical protein
MQLIGILLISLIPAAAVFAVIGMYVSDAEQSSFRVASLKLSGAAAAYVICAATAYHLVAGRERRVDTYELVLTLSGAPNAKETFLKGLGDFQVMFLANGRPGQGVFFSNFTPNAAVTEIRSKVESSERLAADLYTNISVFPKTIGSVSFSLDDHGLRLQDHMMATLNLNPVQSNGGGPQGKELQ